MFDFESEESKRIGSALSISKPFLKRVGLAFIPSSRSLFKPIERLMELVDVVGNLWIFKSRWLLNIDQFGNWSIKKGTLHIHLV
jgi:hypothetical protein